jgi:hypothetical protein
MMLCCIIFSATFSGSIVNIPCRTWLFSCKTIFSRISGHSDASFSIRFSSMDRTGGVILLSPLSTHPMGSKTWRSCILELQRSAISFSKRLWISRPNRQSYRIYTLFYIGRNVLYLKLFELMTDWAGFLGESGILREYDRYLYY